MDLNYPWCAVTRNCPVFITLSWCSALEAQLEEQVTLDNIIFWMHKCKLCGCATHEEQPTNHQVFCVNRRVLFIIFLSKLSQYKTVTQGVLLCLLSHAGIRQQTFNQLFATYMCFTFHNSTTLLIQCMVCARVPSMSMTSHLISRAQGRTTSLLIKLNETEVRWRAERHDSREPSGVSGIEDEAHESMCSPGHCLPLALEQWNLVGVTVPTELTADDLTDKGDTRLS